MISLQPSVIILWHKAYEPFKTLSETSYSFKYQFALMKESTMTNHNASMERFSTNKVSFILTVLFAGALATVIFDFWGPSLSPILGFAELSTIKLPATMIEVVFGAAPTGVPELVHYITGLILYPLGWLLVVRPMWKAILPSLHWTIPAVLQSVRCHQN